MRFAEIDGMLFNLEEIVLMAPHVDASESTAIFSTSGKRTIVNMEYSRVKKLVSVYTIE